MLTRFATRAKLVADTNFVPWTQKKCFWKSSETFLVSARRATMLPAFCHGRATWQDTMLPLQCVLVSRALTNDLFTGFPRPENVPRLFDLVRVKDDKVRTAFYFALKNTLVGDDLNMATRIAYQVGSAGIIESAANKKVVRPVSHECKASSLPYHQYHLMAGSSSYPSTSGAEPRLWLLPLEQTISRAVQSVVMVLLLFLHLAIYLLVGLFGQMWRWITKLHRPLPNSFDANTKCSKSAR